MRLSPGHSALLLSTLLHGAALAGLATLGTASLPAPAPSEPAVVWLHDLSEPSDAPAEPAATTATTIPINAAVLRPTQTAAIKAPPTERQTSVAGELQSPTTPAIAHPADIATARADTPEPVAAAPVTKVPEAGRPPESDTTYANTGSSGPLMTTSTHTAADGHNGHAPASQTKATGSSLGESPVALDRRARPDHGRNPPPVYPRLLREQGIEGTVLVRAAVGPDGLAQTVELVATSGHRLLDQAALRAVQRWRFIPARLNDAPVASVVEFPVSFRLTDTGSPRQ